MGLEMSLFKLNKKISNQEELEHTIDKIEKFNYIKDNLKKFNELANIVDENNGVYNSISKLKNNEKIPLFFRNINENDEDFLNIYEKRVLMYLELYKEFNELISINDIPTSIELTTDNNHCNLTNLIKEILQNIIEDKQFINSPFLISKKDLINLINAIKNTNTENDIIKDIECTIRTINFENETLYCDYCI